MEKASTFRERLKEAMNDASLSQSDLARAIDCNRSKISYYLSGRNEAKDETLFKLSRILNVNPAWLEGYDVPKNPDTKPTTLSEKIEKLNDVAKKKTEEFVDFLLTNPENCKTEEPQQQKRIA